MRPRLPAAILIQSDKPHPTKQQTLALQYAERHGYQVVAVCYGWPDCYVMVVNRTVQAVISALDPGDEARDAIEAAGGRVCVVREGEAIRPRRDVGIVAVRLHHAGMDTREISNILDINSGAVRRALRAHGIKPRSSPE